jgi:hypothetical protein
VFTHLVQDGDDEDQMSVELLQEQVETLLDQVDVDCCLVLSDEARCL